MKNIEALSKEFLSCKKILLALGDENRQHLVLEMMQMGECNGVRVGAITERTHLSRPAVSHHLRILKDAGIISVRHEGTKNYYYFDNESEFIEKLMKMLIDAKDIISSLPDRKEE